MNTISNPLEFKQRNCILVKQKVELIDIEKIQINEEDFEKKICNLNQKYQNSK